MRLTNTLCKQRLTRMWKRIWKDRSKYGDTPLRVSRSLTKTRVKIIDPNQFEGEKQRWEPPVKSDRRFWRPMQIEEMPNYNEDTVLKVTPKTRLLKGVQQASILTKVKQFSGLPSSVEKLVGAVEIPNQDTLVQRYIMQSQVWDPTMDKLPKRIDKGKVGWHFQREYGILNERSSTILMRNMVRLCQSLAGSYPSIMTDRRLIYKPYISTNYYFQDNLITIQGLYEYLISGKEGLPPFASEEEVDMTTTLSLPDISPISPLIDLTEEHCYTLDTLTPFKQDHTHSIPQTLFMLNKNYWNNDQRQARCLLFCHATALAQARKLYGPAVKRLPSPVSVQCINMDPTTVNFLFFQLNTLDFTSKDGVKNMAWFSDNNQLFVKKLSQPWLGPDHLKTEYIDYDPNVFRKFLAVFLNGLNMNKAAVHTTENESLGVQDNV